MSKGPKSPASAGQDMWGGRFAAKPDTVMQAINASIGVDKRLWREDIEGSKAHAAMLAACGIITRDDEAKIQTGLDAIADDIAEGRFVFDEALEDIHLNIEARLTDKIGEPGRRLHTARSRNDQVATDFKLWTARACDTAGEAVSALQRVLLDRADEHADWVMPGFTHLQTAMPITLGHHLLAYVEMLDRDAMRLAAAGSMARDGCPLGAAALAGTGFPIDRGMTAKALGFDGPAGNSLDAVSSRDFALQAVSALAISAVHLSRLAEEIVLWTSPQFGFARLSDAWSTGSSIMPQKRNPDAAELIRAKASRISADFQALAGLMKALPLAYAKDLQEDKTLTFQAFDSFDLCTAALRGMMETITFHREALAAAADKGFSTATELADWLVREQAVAFRDAHHIVGACVKRAESLGLSTLSAMPLAEFAAIDPRISAEAVAQLAVDKAVEARDSLGGTAPKRVREAIARWRAALGAMDDDEA